jgi:hypothetical protein
MHAILLLALFQLPPLPGQPTAQDEDAAIHREMEELIVQVELRQRAIDRMLGQAATGRAAVKEIGGPSIGDLVKQAHDHGVQDQRDIVRILELAASHVHKGNGT